MIRAAILVVSDSASAGTRADACGDIIAQMLGDIESEIVEREIVPDERDEIEAALVRFCAEADLIVTTGGTGVSPRDVTPEATRAVIEKELPGFGEAMRAKGLEKTPHAILSRATAGTRGGTLIVNLPGSPKAVRECLEAVLPAIPHCIEIAKGQGGECARKDK
ncbi:MAG: molybdopterin adenylyltransferase [Planctomycetota bacterium]